MAKYPNINDVINKIRSDMQQNPFLEDITTSFKLSDQVDIRRTLELLNTTNDINLQTKLFSVLSACLLLNQDSNFEIIIKYSAVYDRINNVLVKGLPRKAVHALNFLSTLLYVDAEDEGPTKRRTLALYAKNMTRISGCLGTLSDMFTNCMMYHDTWNALCQCLAAACGDCDLNQSYCTHLIPVCIQRCNQTNIEIFLVLQSLLLNHNRNTELFLKCNGLSIFTRELLHYDKCLQLLISVVQCPASSLLLRQSQVLNDLREFLRFYGPSSQIGQKSMIILNHIGLRSRGSESQINQAHEQNTPNIKSKDINDEQIYETDEKNEQDDTATLMQNVMKEVFNFKQNQLEERKKASYLKKAASKANLNSLTRSTSTMIISFERQRNNREIHITDIPNKTKNLMKEQRRDKLQYQNNAELSFSFLQNNDYINGIRKSKHQIKAGGRSKIINNKRSETEKEVIKTRNDTQRLSQNTEHYTTMSNKKHTFIDPKDFRPIFSSTPKQKDFFILTDHSKITIPRHKETTPQSQTTLQRTRKVVKRRHKIAPPLNNDKKFRNKSLSSRFLSAINESCTTLVKTVANIFKKNDASAFSEDRTETLASRDTLCTRQRSCSFSFLNYMQKRDAVLNKLLKTRKRDCSDFSLETESCETCDSQTLKRKMAKNEHLKQTVKKLKMGINLYGCDFKRISKTMWPRESYMTPIVLYNLYRKLLLK